MLVIQINKTGKNFYKYELNGYWNIILESVSNKNDIFEDVTNIFEEYSNYIIKSVINNSLKDNLKLEIHLSIEYGQLEDILTFIKNLGYNEVGGIS